MRRFLAPRWLAAHAIVLAVVAVCVSLGLWQLRRLEERRALNARVEHRQELPAAALGAPGRGGDGDVAFRTVEVRGAYDAHREVLVAGRSLDGRPGHHVLTPLVTEDGWGVVVERGWVPFDLDRPPVVEAAPPEGSVRAVGIALPSEDAGSPSAGAVLRRPDVAAVASRLPYPVHPFYVRLDHQSPPQEGDLPVTVAPPERSEGPHLGYAVQWFLFAGTALAVYVALVRREACRAPERPSGPRREVSAPPPRIREPG